MTRVDDDAFDPATDLSFRSAAYVAALEQLADVVAKFDPAEILMLGDVTSDLCVILEHRHPEFEAARDVARKTAIKRKRQRGIAKRRTTTIRRGRAAP